MRSIGLITVVVPDYDEAIEFYRDSLGFELIEDIRIDENKRWVVVAPDRSNDRRGAALLLARAANAEQATRIGNQAGGRVFLFLETEDFDRDHAQMSSAGVIFVEPPRHESYGMVAVFEDRFGNRWDLLQRNID